MRSGSEEAGRHVQIGEAAAQAGLTPRTLRFYEETGLLQPPTRMEGGFRLYSDEDIQRLQLIKKMRNLLGFSLAQIKEMVEAEEERGHLREQIRSAPDRQSRLEALRKAQTVTEYQLRMVEEKLSQLAEMRENLRHRLARNRDQQAELDSVLASH